MPPPCPYGSYGPACKLTVLRICTSMCLCVVQVQRTFVAGRVVTETLARLLAERGYEVSSTAGFEDVREIKEKLAFVATNFDDALSLAPTDAQLARSFQLPTELVYICTYCTCTLSIVRSTVPYYAR